MQSSQYTHPHHPAPHPCNTNLSQVSNRSQNKKKIFHEQPPIPNNHLSKFQSNQPSEPNKPSAFRIPLSPESSLSSMFIAPKHTSIPEASIPPKPTKKQEPVFKNAPKFQRKSMFKPPTQRDGETRSINKLTSLAKVKYLNPLARLEYEDRQIQVYTKISRQTQQQVSKKIKAKNQLANFDDDPIDEEKEIDDLIEFKLGKSGRTGFMTYFEQEEGLMEQQRMYCNRCEAFVREDLFKAHESQCRFQYSSDPGRRMGEVSNKLNIIYRLLLQEDQTAEGEVIKKALIDANSADGTASLKKIQESLNRLEVEGDLKILKSRAQEILETKRDLVNK